MSEQKRRKLPVFIAEPLAERVADFVRRSVAEVDDDVRAVEVQVNLGLIVFDLCEDLGLDVDVVLGADQAQEIRQELEQPIGYKLPESPPPPDPLPFKGVGVVTLAQVAEMSPEEWAKVEQTLDDEPPRRRSVGEIIKAGDWNR